MPSPTATLPADRRDRPTIASILGWRAPSRPSTRRAVRAAALAVVALALATLLVAVLEGGAIGSGDASPVYLLAVVLVGSVDGTVAAVLTAIASSLLYDALFTQPHLSFAVSDPHEWLDLLVFLVVAIAIGRLAGLQRDRAELAERRAREATSLFALGRATATAASADDAAPDIARRLATDVGLERVWIQAGEGGGTRTIADTAPGQPIPHGGTVTRLARDPGEAPGDQPARWVRTHEAARQREVGAGGDLQVLRVAIESGDETGRDQTTLGWLGATRERAVGLPDHAGTRLMALAADQVALALSRDRSRRAATDAEIARQGDALKTALVDSVSHDLRTPLASIRATAGTLADPDVDWTADGTQAAGRAIDAEATRLDRLVRGVLDLSRIEAGAIRAHLEPHDLRDLVEPVVGRLAERGRITADLPDGLPAVLVDDTLMDVVLTNLLENAIEHAGPNASVVVAARSGAAPATTIDLTIDDDGPGVPPESLPHLFERFFRVGRGGEGSRRGLGIGLTVVRGLVEAMDERIVVGRGPRGGLAVTVTLRAAPGDAVDGPTGP